MEKTNSNYIIAVDGACATGKSMLAKNIAKRFNITYIDTGAMYRAVALYFINKNIEINESNCMEHINDIDINIEYLNGIMQIFLNNENVTLKIREHNVSKSASQVAKYSVVRDKLLLMQRNISKDKSIVLDGRDIGTVVFPNADIKFYVVTDILERARRRKKQLLDDCGEDISIEKVKEDLEARDHNDMTRQIAPLKKAQDAIVFDTTKFSIQEAIDEICSVISERLKI